MRSSQDEQLYVSDPLALHHIIVKDQYIYEETPMFMLCVLQCDWYSGWVIHLLRPQFKYAVLWKESSFNSG